MTNPRKRILNVALLALFIYFGAYACLRFSHHFVHRVAWEFDPVGAGEPKAPAIHWVCRGNDRDAVIGFSAPYQCGPPSFRYWPADAAMWYIFSPSAELEARLWRIMKPSVYASDSIFDAEREDPGANHSVEPTGASHSAQLQVRASVAAGPRGSR
jgi:hypothetical protein